MAHTNSTPNYNLPQFLGTDKPAWLTDVNNAMSDIDTAIAAAKTTADSADTAVSALAITVGNHTSQLSTLSGAVTSQGNTLNTVTSLIGNGTPTTTDQTIIGAINELHANQGNLTALTTSDKDSLVEAVNELNADITNLAGETIAESSANKSYGVQLSELQSAYTSLNSNQKMRAKVYLGDFHFWLRAVNDNGLFSVTYYTNGHAYILSCDIVNAKMYSVEDNVGTDYSANPATLTMKLIS